MSCIVPNCKNGKRSKMDNLSFHEFPSDLNVRKLWLEVIEKPNWTPNTTSNSSRICSMHFEESDFALTATKRKRLRPGVIPSIFWDEHGNIIKKVIDSAYMDTIEPILKHSRWVPETNNLPVHESKYPPLMEQHANMTKNQDRPIVVEEEDNDSVAGQNIGLVLSSQHMVQNADGTPILVLLGDSGQIQGNNQDPDHGSYCTKPEESLVKPNVRFNTINLKAAPLANCQSKGNATNLRHYRDPLEVRKWKKKYHAANRKISQLQNKLKKYQKLSKEIKARSGIIKQAIRIAQSAEMNHNDAFLYDLINNFEKKKRVFSESTIKHCNTWQNLSAKGYEYPRKNGLLTLPSRHVLQKYLEQIAATPAETETLLPDTNALNCP